MVGVLLSVLLGRRASRDSARYTAGVVQAGRMGIRLVTVAACGEEDTLTDWKQARLSNNLALLRQLEI